MPAENLIEELARLFESRKEQLYVSAIAITRDRAAAEDVVLDTLLAVSQLGKAPDDLPAYVFRTVRNKALHSNKQAQRFRQQDENKDELSQFVDTQQHTPEQQIFAAQVIKHLETLDVSQQQVLIMKLFGDLTYKEIAEIMATNQNTVASWYRRGLASLKETLHEPAL